MSSRWTAGESNPTPEALGEQEGPVAARDDRNGEDKTSPFRLSFFGAQDSEKLVRTNATT